jgi:hypothetical protein
MQEAASAREAQQARAYEAAARALNGRVAALQAELGGVADFRERQVGFEQEGVLCGVEARAAARRPKHGGRAARVRRRG